MNTSLQKFRFDNNLSQLEISNILEISTSYYVKIELGQRNPSYNFLKKFKEVFECNIDEIFFNS